MVFDRADPIAAYVLSEVEVASALVGAKKRAFEEFIEAQLASEGEICVTSQKALFVAHKTMGASAGERVC